MSHRPLEGIRLIEVAQWVFTPAAAGLLADWGAEIIKIEHPESGDAQRGLRQPMFMANDGSNYNGLMEHSNRGKKSIGVGLETEAGREVLYALVKEADVFLTNFLPDARRRLKIEAEDIQAINPNIIFARGSALGVKGPEAHLGGFDAISFWARGGAMWTVTPPDADRMFPMPIGAAYGDNTSAMNLASGIAAALLMRERTGKAPIVDVSLLGAGAWAMAAPVGYALRGGEPRRQRALASERPIPFNPLFASYETSDKRWIMLGAMAPERHWPELSRRIGQAALADDGRFTTRAAIIANAAEAAVIIQKAIGQRSAADWRETFKGAPFDWTVMQSGNEAAHDAQLRANGFVSAFTDAEGAQRELVTSPVQFNETPATLSRGPTFAEHTDEILSSIGLSEDEIIQLKVDGVVT